MKAIQFNQFGAPEVLVWADIPKPLISSDTLLLKVLAAGVNPIDAKIRDGSSFVATSLVLPSGLGFDVSGEVVECGHAVNQFKKGNIVLGTVGRHDHPSAYAEYCLAKPDDVILKEPSLGILQAAALPIAGLTAWQAVHEYGKLQGGERVLIHAAAGGVGHLAVQFAKLAGATVIATASSQHHDFLKSLAVDQLIDYRQVSFEEVVTDVDAVIDLVGGEVGMRSLRVLNSSGRIITVPTITRDDILAKAKLENIEAIGMLAETNVDDLKKIAALVAAKKVQLNIAAEFPLSEAVKAHRFLEEKHTRGKIVLKR